MTRSFTQGIMARLEIDRAVIYSVSTKLFTLGAGIVSLWLIAFKMSPEIQGFYFTFGSLMALQSFFELAFYLVITQFASHEWANLKLNDQGYIVGQADSLSRLVSLGRLIVKWYAVASGLFIVVVGTAGFIFFSTNAHAEISWQGPWICVVLLTGIQLWLLPILSMLEGCNQVAQIMKFRFIQSVSSNVCMWLALILGFRLWIAPVWTGVGVVCLFYLLIKNYRHFFLSFYAPSSIERIDWRQEIWPMQWRLALLGVVHYFAYSLFTPVMFKYHGAVIAGKMGMTWAMGGAIGSIGSSWMSTKVPIFGMLIAKKKFQELDRIFIRSAFSSLGVVFLGAVVAWSIIYLLQVTNHYLATRMLSPFPAGLFLAASVLMHISFCEFTYLRAHKQEPLVWIGVFSSLAIGCLAWLLGSRYGPIGAASGYLVVILGILLPGGTLIGWRCRRLWHGLK